MAHKLKQFYRKSIKQSKLEKLSMVIFVFFSFFNWSTLIKIATSHLGGCSQIILLAFLKDKGQSLNQIGSCLKIA